MVVLLLVIFFLFFLNYGNLSGNVGCGVIEVEGVIWGFIEELFVVVVIDGLVGFFVDLFFVRNLD